MSKTVKCKFYIGETSDGSLGLLVERFGGKGFKDEEEIGIFLEEEGMRLARIGLVAQLDAKAEKRRRRAEAEGSVTN